MQYGVASTSVTVYLWLSFGDEKECGKGIWKTHAFTQCDWSALLHSAFVGLGVGLLLWFVFTALSEEIEDELAASQKEEWTRMKARIHNERMQIIRNSLLRRWFKKNENLKVIRRLWGKNYASIIFPSDPRLEGRYAVTTSLTKFVADEGLSDKSFTEALRRYGTYSPVRRIKARPLWQHIFPHGRKRCIEHKESFPCEPFRSTSGWKAEKLIWKATKQKWKAAKLKRVLLLTRFLVLPTLILGYWLSILRRYLAHLFKTPCKKCAKEDEREKWQVHTQQFIAHGKKDTTWDSVCFSVELVKFNENGNVTHLDCRPCSYLKGVLSQTAFLRLRHETRPTAFHGEKDAYTRIYGSSRQKAEQAPEFASRVESDFHPLLTVQGIVLYQDNDGHEDQPSKREWRICLMRRTEESLYQLPPAGSCEVYQQSPRSDTISQEFDVLSTLQREFLEEVFGDTDLEHHDGRLNLYANEGLRETRAMFNTARRAGAPIPGSDHVHFLGSIVEPYTLVLAMCFVIVVQSERVKSLCYPRQAGGFARFMEGSKEDSGFESYPLASLPSLLNSSFADHAGDVPKQTKEKKMVWHSTSAAALHLLAEQTRVGSGWLWKHYPDIPHIAEGITARNAQAQLNQEANTPALDTIS